MTKPPQSTIIHAPDMTKPPQFTIIHAPDMPKPPQSTIIHVPDMPKPSQSSITMRQTWPNHLSLPSSMRQTCPNHLSLPSSMRQRCPNHLSLPLPCARHAQTISVFHYHAPDMPKPPQSSFLDNQFQLLQCCLLPDFLISDICLSKRCLVSIAETHDMLLPPVWGRGTPLHPLSIYFLIFSPLYFSLSFIGFTYFLLLSIPSFLPE